MPDTPQLLPLHHGDPIPRVGFGTGDFSDDEAEVRVADALTAGYRLIDTAENYRSEIGVGRGIARSGVPRKEIFLTTKFNVGFHGVDLVREAWAESTERMGVDYIDLFLIHWPNPSVDRYVDAWRGLIKLLEEGLVRSIGVSNFTAIHIQRILDETGVVPDVNQVGLNPRTTRPGLRAFHAEHGIVTQAYYPLGSGTGLLEEPVVVDVASRYERSAAQIVLRWHVELGLVPVSSSRSAARAADNLNIFDFSLAPEDVERLSALDTGQPTGLDPDVFGH